MQKPAKTWTVIDEAATIENMPALLEALKKSPAPDYMGCKGASRDRNPDGTWGPWYAWCDDEGNPQYRAPDHT
jgi:hypothetical protein